MELRKWAGVDGPSGEGRDGRCARSRDGVCHTGGGRANDGDGLGARADDACAQRGANHEPNDSHITRDANGGGSHGAEPRNGEMGHVRQCDAHEDDDYDGPTHVHGDTSAHSKDAAAQDSASGCGHAIDTYEQEHAHEDDAQARHGDMAGNEHTQSNGAIVARVRVVGGAHGDACADTDMRYARVRQRLAQAYRRHLRYAGSAHMSALAFVQRVCTCTRVSVERRLVGGSVAVPTMHILRGVELARAPTAVATRTAATRIPTPSSPHCAISKDAEPDDPLQRTRPHTPTLPLRASATLTSCGVPYATILWRASDDAMQPLVVFGLLAPSMRWRLLCQGMTDGTVLRFHGLALSAADVHAWQCLRPCVVDVPFGIRYDGGRAERVVPTTIAHEHRSGSRRINGTTHMQ